MQGGLLEWEALSFVATTPTLSKKGWYKSFGNINIRLYFFKTSKALKCLSSWVQFGVTITEVDDALPQVFESVLNPELFDTSVDLIVEVATHPSGIK